MKAPVSFAPPSPLTILLALAATLGLTGCGPSAPPPVNRVAPPPAPPSAEVRRADAAPSYQPGNTGGSQRQRQVEFLNRLRAADPQFKTIDRAVLNDRDELGLVLDHTVSLDAIPALMRTLLGQLAKEFPGQDLNVIAYAPSNPPMKIGTAHLDARTRDMTFTREHP